MVYRATHPANALEDIREEYKLSLDDVAHAQWLQRGGLLSLTHVRTMIARRSVATLDERHGFDVNDWPSLSRVDPSPSAKSKTEDAPVVSHRGWGAIPGSLAPRVPEYRSPSVIQLVWGTAGNTTSPAPVLKEHRRAQTASPNLKKEKRIDLRQHFAK